MAGRRAISARPGPTPPARRVPPGEKTQTGRPVEPRCGPPRRRRDHVRVVPEASEANADPVRARIRWRAEQDDHPHGDECARTIEIGPITDRGRYVRCDTPYISRSVRTRAESGSRRNRCSGPRARTARGRPGIFRGQTRPLRLNAGFSRPPARSPAQRERDLRTGPPSSEAHGGPPAALETVRPP